jgi:hypothetical protein
MTMNVEAEIKELQATTTMLLGVVAAQAKLISVIQSALMADSHTYASLVAQVKMEYEDQSLLMALSDEVLEHYRRVLQVLLPPVQSQGGMP